MSKTQYLSKSDFQLASSCAKKLVYKKKGYDSSNDTDEYMMMLAQGGYIVGKMATLLFPDGIEVEGSTTESLLKTKEHIQNHDSITHRHYAKYGRSRSSRANGDSYSWR